MPEHLDAEERVALAKAFFDHLWSRGMTDIVNVIGSATLSEDFEVIATRLNQGNAAHAYDLRSFKDTYVKEIKGALDLLADTGADILEWMFERATGQGADSTVESRRDAKQHVFALLAAIAEKGKAAEAFPTLHAQADVTRRSVGTRANFWTAILCSTSPSGGGGGVLRCVLHRRTSPRHPHPEARGIGPRVWVHRDFRYE